MFISVILNFNNYEKNNYSSYFPQPFYNKL